MSITKNKGFVSIIAAIIILAVGFAGLFSYSKKIEEKMGATIPVVVAVWESTLASKMTVADTSATLVTGTTKSGSSLNGYICFTISGGKTDEEFVCGTASSTSVTGLIRGLDPVTVATTTALIKEHRAGSNVKITDYPQLAIISRILNGDETVPNTLTYATDTASFTLNQQIINKRYVDSVATSGAAQANYQTSGLVRIATTSELVAGTATTTGITYLVPNAGFFNQTSSAKNICPVTNTSGKLSSGFIDQTAPYTWSGTTTFSAATTTITGNTSLANTTINNTLTVTGTTTFVAIPTLPSATPTADYQPATKIYADTLIQTVTTTANAIDTDYQNTSGKTKIVMVSVTLNSGAGAGASGGVTAKVGISTTTYSLIANINQPRDSVGNTENRIAELMFIVPNNYYYRASSTNYGGTVSINTWTEAY